MESEILLTANRSIFAGRLTEKNKSSRQDSDLSGSFFPGHFMNRPSIPFGCTIGGKLRSLPEVSLGIALALLVVSYSAARGCTGDQVFECVELQLCSCSRY